MVGEAPHSHSGGAGILFTISVLWYWGSKRKVLALDSQKVLLADLFRVKHPADEDARRAAAPAAPLTLNPDLQTLGQRRIPVLASGCI